MTQRLLEAATESWEGLLAGLRDERQRQLGALAELFDNDEQELRRFLRSLREARRHQGR